MKRRRSIEQHLRARNARRSKRPQVATLVRETLEWLHIAEQREEYGDCWLWTGATNAQGYPIIKWPGCTCATVRRVVLALDARPAGPRQPVVPTCGERACVNPAHLVRSSIRQVAQRAAKAGAFSTPLRAARIAAGKRASNQAKLTAEQARQIRESHESGPVLALRYGVDKSMINNIKRGEAWRVYASPFAGLGARA